MAEPSRGRLHLEDAGLWVQVLAGKAETAGRPALFLDRDGTVNIDTGYPKTPREIVLRPEILPVIRAANDARVPAVVVSNQSGIARGMLDWHDFAAVNERLLNLLDEQRCSIALVLACAYHQAGRPPLDIADHPMRKPNPGMLLHARALLEIDLSRSIVVGDKPSDMEAGRRAGAAAGWLIGESQVPRDGFSCRLLRDEADQAALCSAITGLSA